MFDLRNILRCLISFAFYIDKNKLMKGKALRKHGKTAASVLLKLFISGNE